MIVGPGGVTSRTADAGSCVAETRRGEGVPLDMFVMMDRSGSMKENVNGGQKWSLLVQAFQSFLNDPQSAGIGIGIQYFSLTTDGQNPGRNNISCNVGDYAAAAVPIAALPGNAAAIVGSMSQLQPAGETPTLPALQGAIQFAQSWATQNPAHKTIVVLATDGQPNVCQSTIQAVTQAAATGVAGTPSMQTYVVGVGSSLGNLNQIAQAGGTMQALIVDTSQNTTQQFIDAMNKIRGEALVPCEITVPAPTNGGTLDFTKVNVKVTPGNGGAPVELLQAPSSDKCDPQGGGWYYDDPQAPKKILLCPASCDAVKADTGSQVDFELGCQSTRTIQ